MKEPAMTISAAAQQNYSHLFPHDVSTLADTDPELRSRGASRSRAVDTHPSPERPHLPHQQQYMCSIGFFGRQRRTRLTNGHIAHMYVTYQTSSEPYSRRSGP
jgi:hypothetical protein